MNNVYQFNTVDELIAHIDNTRSTNVDNSVIARFHNTIQAILVAAQLINMYNYQVFKQHDEYHLLVKYH